jgi:peroxin-19
MSQLMSKDVLYEPLKELHTKVRLTMRPHGHPLSFEPQFPGYLKDNSSTLSEFDRKRYESQANYVSQIMTIYDDPKFNEEGAESSAKIVNIMTEVSARHSILCWTHMDNVMS